MPVSISQYVLKVASRCDLACDHCYVYEQADQSWKAKPRFMVESVAREAARRISEHARVHQLSMVHVVLHGGEPLLLGRDRLSEILSALRSSIDPVARLDLRIHTNGVRLDEGLCGLFADHAVRVGVSLDGDRAANDLHRLFADGRSSYSQARQALSLLRRPEYRHLYAGILCTVDLRNDPLAVYEALLAEAPPRVDVLLPHATWEQPPYRPAKAEVPYASWLEQVHARWLADGRPFPIRFFDSLVDAWHGRPSGSEAVGLDPVDLLVIETDGSWEQADSLKAAFHGAPETGMDIFSHSVDEAAAFGGAASRQGGLGSLCRTCRECPVVRACGGGLYAHRFSRANGFNNPSIYCADLKKIIPVVVARAPAAPAPSEPPGDAGDAAERHALPADGFERLSAGPGDVATMAALTESSWSVTRAMVAAVGSGTFHGDRELSRAAAEGWNLLAQLDDDHPQAVREVLTYPYVRAWAARCLAPPPDADTGLDRAHLAGLAAAAALRAGVEAELALPVRDGRVHLPGMGMFTAAAAKGRTSAIRISASGMTFRDAPGDWQPVRRFTAGDMSFTVDDIDAFRDCQAWVPAGRLSAPDWHAWQRALTVATRQLATELPVYASVIAAGLRSVVPMAAAVGHSASATARHAFGAVALALPDGTDMLTELLVHEMQHVKLTALCDLMDLFDPADPAVYWVPWRSEPRPLDGVLNGTYAYLAVGELWRSRARRKSDSQAYGRFRKCQFYVERGIATLRNAAALTSAGVHFVHGMDSAMRSWASER